MNRLFALIWRSLPVLAAVALFGVAWAAEGGGGEAHAEAAHIPWKEIGLHAVNFFILAAALGWFFGRKVRDAVRGRSAETRIAIDEAEALRADARKRHDELEQRLAGFESQLAEMKAEAERDAIAERETILARAERDARMLQESAQRTIRDETRRARQRLRRDAVTLAVGLARERMTAEIGPEDEARLADQFLAAVEDGADEVKHG